MCFHNRGFVQAVSTSGCCSLYPLANAWSFFCFRLRSHAFIHSFTWLPECLLWVRHFSRPSVTAVSRKHSVPSKQTSPGEDRQTDLMGLCDKDSDKGNRWGASRRAGVWVELIRLTFPPLVLSLRPWDRWPHHQRIFTWLSQIAVFPFNERWIHRKRKFPFCKYRSMFSLFHSKDHELALD